jgi:hypothetical protein
LIRRVIKCDQILIAWKPWQGQALSKRGSELGGDRVALAGKSRQFVTEKQADKWIASLEQTRAFD